LEHLYELLEHLYELLEHCIRNDMNTDTDESDGIVVDLGGGDVGRRGRRVAGISGPAGAAASTEVEMAAVEEGGGGELTRVTRQRAKGNTRASTSEPAAKAIKVFTSTGELERKKSWI
jgi:hypothetical protein